MIANSALYEGPVVSKEHAKWLGLKRYFTGLPCKNGHLAERQVRDDVCRECLRLRQVHYKSQPRVTHEELLRLISYNPDTGLFVWLVSPSRYSKEKPGDLTGQVPDKKGYLRVNIHGKCYKSHILAIFYMTKEWPKHECDHRNGIKTDNRWVNLREATTTQNSRNRKLRSNNTSGYKGVSFEKRYNSWVAHITIDKKTVYLGSFKDKDIAYNAYVEAANKHFGEFARLR